MADEVNVDEDVRTRADKRKRSIDLTIDIEATPIGEGQESPRKDSRNALLRRLYLVFHTEEQFMCAITVPAFSFSDTDDTFANTYDAYRLDKQERDHADQPYILFESKHFLPARKELADIRRKIAYNCEEAMQRDHSDLNVLGTSNGKAKSMANGEESGSAAAAADAAMAECMASALSSVSCVHWKFGSIEDNGKDEYVGYQPTVKWFPTNLAGMKRSLQNYIMHQTEEYEDSSNRDAYRLCTLMHIRKVHLPQGNELKANQVIKLLFFCRHDQMCYVVKRSLDREHIVQWDWKCLPAFMRFALRQALPESILPPPRKRELAKKIQACVTEHSHQELEYVLEKYKMKSNPELAKERKREIIRETALQRKKMQEIKRKKYAAKIKAEAERRQHGWQRRLIEKEKKRKVLKRQEDRLAALKMQAAKERETRKVAAVARHRIEMERKRVEAIKLEAMKQAADAAARAKRKVAAKSKIQAAAAEDSSKRKISLVMSGAAAAAKRAKVGSSGTSKKKADPAKKAVPAKSSVCDLCGKEFKSGSALGGHRAHCVHDHEKAIISLTAANQADAEATSPADPPANPE